MVLVFRSCHQITLNIMGVGGWCASSVGTCNISKEEPNRVGSNWNVYVTFPESAAVPLGPGAATATHLEMRDHMHLPQPLQTGLTAGSLGPSIVLSGLNTNKPVSLLLLRVWTVWCRSGSVTLIL